MKEDALLDYIKKQEAQIATHAETINTLNKNQQVLVKKWKNSIKTSKLVKKVDEIVKAVKEETKK